MLPIGALPISVCSVMHVCVCMHHTAHTDGQCDACVCVHACVHMHPHVQCAHVRACVRVCVCACVSPPVCPRRVADVWSASSSVLKKHVLFMLEEVGGPQRGYIEKCVDIVTRGAWWVKPKDFFRWWCHSFFPWKTPGQTRNLRATVTYLGSTTAPHCMGTPMHTSAEEHIPLHR